MIAQHAAHAYARIGLETGVAAASPHRLIVMLYDGAIAAIADGKAHMQGGRIADKGRALSKAIAIIDEGLKASLDRTQGGTIATQLFELYLYIGQRLIQGNLHNDSGALDEATRLLRELRSAWAELAERESRKAPAALRAL